jgi:hypothetical protein
VFHFPSVHVARAYRPDECSASPPTQGENHENSAPSPGLANSLEAFFGFGMQRIGQDIDLVLK